MFDPKKSQSHIENVTLGCYQFGCYAIILLATVVKHRYSAWETINNIITTN